jgi:hypothetical protein
MIENLYFIKIRTMYVRIPDKFKIIAIEWSIYDDNIKVMIV